MSNNDKLKTVLNPRDRMTLDATAGTSWAPKDPLEVLLPYMEKGPEPDKTDLDERRKKAKEVYDGYGEIIERTKELSDEISERCKNVVITLDPSKHMEIIASVKRVFGGNGKQVTFQMYQRCIEELASTSNNNIPKPGGKTR